MNPVHLSVALVVATAAASILPGIAGGVALWSLPHVGILALVMVSAEASGWLTERRAAAVLADGLHVVLNRALSAAAAVAGMTIPSVVWEPVGALDGMHPWVVVGAYLVAYDTIGAMTHRAFHALPALWPIHEVHHNQAVFQPTLASRVHVAESSRSIAASIFVGWILGGDTSALWVVAVFLPAWGYANHLPIRVPVGPLDRILVTPQYHAIHHSVDPRHHDRNFGNIVTLGDLLMGTACFDFGAVREYGTGERPAWEADAPTIGAAVRAWWGALWHPVRVWMR